MSTAERLLHDLGVTEPREIDVEAIAFHVGARVRYRVLDGCEARIVGTSDKAIISVNAYSGHRRRRFSIAHELGHWEHHRGRCLTCRAEDYRPRSVGSAEWTADRYAADLLMPTYLLEPLARKLPRLDFGAVDALAEEFETSLTATAIRLVEGDYAPSMLVCHGPEGRKWFARAPSVPERWFPQKQLDRDTFAFDVLFGGEAVDQWPRKIEASAWFEPNEAGRYEILEHTVRTGPKETLTLLLLDDDDMLEDRGGYRFRRGGLGSRDRL